MTAALHRYRQMVKIPVIFKVVRSDADWLDNNRRTGMVGES